MPLTDSEFQRVKINGLSKNFSKNLANGRYSVEPPGEIHPLALQFQQC